MPNTVLPDINDKHLALLHALKDLDRYKRERDDALDAVDQLQRQLADSQALSRVGTWRRTIGTDDLFWSDQTYQIHGLSPSTELTRELVIGLVHENDRERVRVEFDAAIQERRSFRIIYRIRRPDGEVRILHADNMVSEDGPEGIAMVYGAVHDITETPLPTTAPLGIEKKIPDDSLIIDPAGIIMRHSGSFTSWVKHLEAGSSVFRLFAAETSHEILAQAMDRMEADMKPRIVSLAMDPDESKGTRRFELRPWTPFGEWWGFVMVEAESDLQAASWSSRDDDILVQEPLVSGAWERNMMNDTIIWSRAMYEILECNPADPPLSRAEFGNLVHEDDVTEFARMSRQLDDTKLPITHEFRVSLPSGTQKKLRVHAEYLNRTDTNSHIMGTLTDISKTTDLQQAARISDLKERQLRKELGASRQELKLASLRLQTAQEKERLRIATELHDEAGGLLTALNFTLNELKGHGPDHVHEKASHLLDELTEQIRDTTRKLRPSVLDRFGLVEGLKQLAEDMAPLGGWSLELDLPPADSYMEDELTDAIYGTAREALLNALKHSQASVVRVLLDLHPNQCVLVVEDNGVGFPENMQSDVSSGLGLATMKDRVLSLGGSMKIDRLKSGGTRVTAIFHVHPQDSADTLS